MVLWVAREGGSWFEFFLWEHVSATSQRKMKQSKESWLALGRGKAVCLVSVLGGSHGGKKSVPSSFSALTLSAVIVAATCQPKCIDTLIIARNLLWERHSFHLLVQQIEEKVMWIWARFPTDTWVTQVPAPFWKPGKLCPETTWTWGRKMLLWWLVSLGSVFMQNWCWQDNRKSGSTEDWYLCYGCSSKSAFSVAQLGAWLPSLGIGMVKLEQ